MLRNAVLQAASASEARFRPDQSSLINAGHHSTPGGDTSLPRLYWRLRVRRLIREKGAPTLARQTYAFAATHGRRALIQWNDFLDSAHARTKSSLRMETGSLSQRLQRVSGPHLFRQQGLNSTRKHAPCKTLHVLHTSPHASTRL